MLRGLLSDAHGTKTEDVAARCDVARRLWQLEFRFFFFNVVLVCGRDVSVYLRFFSLQYLDYHIRLICGTFFLNFRLWVLRIHVTRIILFRSQPPEATYGNVG